MNPHQFHDEQGNVILTVSSSIPGLTIVPPGKTAEDAVPMTHEDYDKHLTKVADDLRKNPPISRIDDLTNKLAALQADVQKIKDKQK